MIRVVPRWPAAFAEGATGDGSALSGDLPGSDPSPLSSDVQETTPSSPLPAPLPEEARPADTKVPNPYEESGVVTRRRSPRAKCRKNKEIPVLKLPNNTTTPTIFNVGVARVYQKVADIAKEALGDLMTSKEHAEGLKAAFQTKLFEDKLGKAVSSAVTYRTKQWKKTLITQVRGEINTLLNETVKTTHDKMVQVI